MATQKTIGVFEQMRVDAVQRAKLQDMDRKRMTLGEEEREALSGYKTSLDKILEGKQDAKVEELSILGKGIQRGKQHQAEMAEVTESLTLELNDLGEFFSGLNQYQGLEKFAARFGFKRTANKMQRDRVNRADVKQSYQTVIDYGHMVIKILYESVLENMNAHAGVEATVQTTANKLKEHQPKYEAARAKKEQLEIDLKAIQDRQDKAEAAEFAQLAGTREELERKVQEAKIEEDYHFTIVDKAKQALPVQRTYLKGFADIINGIMKMRTGLEQNLENVTEMYLQTPVAIKSALRVKGASTYDSAMKFATDKGIEVVLASAAGILDETAKRDERPLIEPERLDAYRKAQIEMRAKFDEVGERMKRDYTAAQGSK